MTTETPMLTAGFWRTRRSAAIAGILFGVLLLTAMAMLRLALSEGSVESLQSDAQRRNLIRLSAHRTSSYSVSAAAVGPSPLTACGVS
jgi:hypothetical protein